MRILSSESSVMPFDHTIPTKLKEKHPSEPMDLDLPAPPTETEGELCTSVSREETRKCIMRFKPGSGAGHDCSFPQHLKDLSMESLGAVSNDLLDALCLLFYEVILKGKIPNEICSSYYGAKLFALSKDDGGVRPIAVGITLSRLAAKLCMNRLKDISKTTFFTSKCWCWNLIRSRICHTRLQTLCQTCPRYSQVASESRLPQCVQQCKTRLYAQNYSIKTS